MVHVLEQVRLWRHFVVNRLRRRLNPWNVIFEFDGLRHEESHGITVKNTDGDGIEVTSYSDMYSRYEYVALNASCRRALVNHSSTSNYHTSTKVSHINTRSSKYWHHVADPPASAGTKMTSKLQQQQTYSYSQNNAQHATRVQQRICNRALHCACW